MILAALSLAVRAHPAFAVLDIEDKGPVLKAGGFALRVTNAGIIGNAFLDKGLSFDPSFEIQPGSGYEALNHAELWVGAETASGEIHVSGNTLLEWRPTLDPDDRVQVVDQGGPGTRRGVDDDGDGKIDEELPNGKDDDGDGEIDEDLGVFAQEMMTADYVDDRPESRYIVSERGESHVPLELSVHQEAYAWSAPGYDGIAGLWFHVTNHGNQILKNVRIGLMADLDSRERNDRGGHLDDLIEQVSYSRVAFEGAYTMTVAGVCASGDHKIPPCGASVCTSRLTQTLPVLYDSKDPHLPAVAVVPLSHPTDPLALIEPIARYARAPGSISFKSSVFARGRIPGQGGPPAIDRECYDALAGNFPVASTDVPEDYTVLVSCGPFASLAPGQSLDFDVALVGALNRDTMATFMGNAAVLEHGFLTNVIPDSIPALFPDEWYLGTSGRTGHEACIEVPPGVTLIWDPHCTAKFGPDAGVPELPIVYPQGKCIWTDADCNVCTGIGGNETRVHWLDPGGLPIPPTFRVVSKDHALEIEWDNRPEVLLAAGLSDYADMTFAGYRVYKLANWRGRKSLLPPHENWALWGAFGTRGNHGETALASITDTTIDYERILYEHKLYPVGRYAVADTEVLNGFDYGYVVTTVFERDIIDEAGHIRSVRYESPFTPVFDQIVQPHAAARPRAGAVWVVPNPFRARETWQRPPVLGDPLTRHIDFMGLPRSRCRIKIWTVAGDHVATLDHDGSSGDGEAAWDLVSRNGQEIESGIYLFTVDSSLGHQTGKFVVIR